MISESLPACIERVRQVCIRDQSMRSVKSGSEVTFFVF
jgi:hypothetical protein